MQSWEYLQVCVIDRNWADSLGRNGQLAPGPGLDWRLVTPLLNELGGEGWELVGTTSGDGRANIYQLFLKRPRP